jgi:hypothetical protein
MKTNYDMQFFGVDERFPVSGLRTRYIAAGSREAVESYLRDPTDVTDHPGDINSLRLVSIDEAKEARGYGRCCLNGNMLGPRGITDLGFHEPAPI